MLNYQALNCWLDAKMTGLHHRQLLLIELPIEETIPIIKNICTHFPEVTAMITEHSSFKCTTNIPMSRYQDYLGKQTDALVFDASSGVQLNALYAGAGMVRVNGIVAVLLDRGDANSADKNRFKFNFGQQQTPSYFNELFKDRAQKFNACMISETLTILPSSEIKTIASSQLALINSFRDVKTSFTLEQKIKQTTVIAAEYDNKLSSTQFKIAEKIISNIVSDKNHSHNVSVILGPRGRGKSTLLGAIGAKLKQLSYSNSQTFEIATTALHRNQLGAVYQAYSLYSQEIANSDLLDSLNINKSFDGILPFYSPDEIIALAPNNAIVLIDEISSIAPELLKNIVTHFSHIVIAGTTSGYEGSGNGFMKRVLPYIQSLKKTSIYELKRPFRWLENDPVEACFADILSSEQHMARHEQVPVRQSELKDVSFRLLQKEELLNNKQLYNQLFSLLTQAHYQTTPNDIVRTLDANECKIFIAENNCTMNKNLPPFIIAVAVVFEEGGSVLETLANEISVGTRRVQGHLSAQGISLQLFSPEICVNTYLRINRIAVQNQYTRKGVASRLLGYCEQYAIQHNIDYMSVSFGYTHWLYKFWQHNHYLVAKIGQRIDTASGTASLLMIKPLSKTGNINLSTLRDRITLDLDYYFEVNKKLVDIFKELINELSLNSEYAGVNSEFLKLLLKLYINKQINFQKFAPGLLSIIKFSGNHMSSAKQKILYDLFISLHQKGMHKEEKQELETLLLTELNEC